MSDAGSSFDVVSGGELFRVQKAGGDTTKVVKEARPLDNCTLMSKPVNTARLLAAAHIATKTGAVPQD